jgi:uncharacterized protein (TIGR02117 family)
LKRALKILKLSFIFLAGSIVIYFLFAIIFSAIPVQKEKNHPEEISIYISTNGMHTDFIFPVKSEEIDWSREVKFSDTKGKDSIQQYIAVGWGDKGFFLNVPDWNHVKFSVAFKAASGLSSTAIHTTYLKKVTEDDQCKKILISKSQYKRLIRYIQKDFKTDKNGNFIMIKTDNTYGVSDSFYEARGTYNVLFTCNTWANSALKQAGMKACLWTPIQQGIFYQYE